MQHAPEVPHVVLEDEDDFLRAWDAVVGLASGVEVVDGATQVLEKERPIARLHENEISNQPQLTKKSTNLGNAQESTGCYKERYKIS